MGVSGCGKSSVAESVATRCDALFVDADAFHLPSSIEKMSAGVPLADDDRWPWLLRLERELAARDRVVMACSALRRSYRDILRRAGGVRFLFLDVSRDEVERRVASRSGHYMGTQMIASQFAALERPEADETDICTIAADAAIGIVTETAIELAS